MTGAAQAYDALGPQYAEVERGNRILRHYRRQSLAFLEEVLPRGGQLLELGCGTGTEAVHLSGALRARVVAVEPAASLAGIAHARARAAGAAVEVRNVDPMVLLAEMAAEGRTFDAAWASFSLGYGPPLGEWARALAPLLRPGGVLACSLRNPWCLSEPWSIPRRRQGTYRHKVGSARIPLWHLDAKRAAAEVDEWFEPLGHRGVGIVVPPPRYNRVWRLAGPAAGWLETLDAHLAGRRVWSGLGDHTLLAFTRKPGLVGP